MTTFATLAEAHAFAATVLTSSGGRTHLPVIDGKVHASDCDGAVRVHLCGCVKRYQITGASSMCGALSRDSRSSLGRYASARGGLIARDGAAPTCARCSKNA